MDDAWIFTHPDTWTRTDAPEWLAGEDDDAHMGRLGYSYCQRSWQSDLCDFFGAWTLYQAGGSAADAQYALLLSLPNDQCTHVWLPTVPDLMAYMRLYGSAGQEELARVDWEASHQLMKRLFRAWHGHDAENSCRVCDPEAYATWQQTRAYLAARKVAAT